MLRLRHNSHCETGRLSARQPGDSNQMKRIDIDAAIRSHNQWRRQFLNAFAGGDYVDMPLSEHRSCLLSLQLGRLRERHAGNAVYQALLAADERFHDLANEVIELSNNGMASTADLLLPELNEAAHQLIAQLDAFRPLQTD